MLSIREKLQLVPWDNLHHAYGTAQDTPTWLLALLSDQEEQWDEALNKLWISICHQGSVYEASCAAVPFLIEMLGEVPELRKPEILSLLDGLAHVYWYANKDQRFLRIDNDGYQQWHSWGEFLTRGNEYHRPHWMAQAHQLVGEGINIYLALLQSPEKKVVRETLGLLAGFQEQNALLVPATAPFAFEETRPDVQSAALHCLGALLEQSSPLWKQYQQLIQSSDAHTEARFAAAYTLAWYHPSGVSRETIEALLASVLPPQPCDGLREICEALSHLAMPSGFQGLVDALHHGAEHWHILDTMRVAEALLDVAFFRGWVQRRYWCRTDFDEHENSLVKNMAPDQKSDHSSIDEAISSQQGEDEACFQWDYSISNGTVFDEFAIGCFGYAKAETQKLRDLFAREGQRALSHPQRLALETLLHCEPLWQVKHNLAEIYGLPTARHELEAFLAGK